MAKPNFRVIGNEHEHPMDRARRLVAEWRSNDISQSLRVSTWRLRERDGLNKTYSILNYS